MPNIDLSILNQRQTPAFYADVFANRPTAGFVGRIFVSTDTFAFYRDNGSGWDLIGGPGTGTITGTGASGQIALWNGASTITGDTGLTYDGTDNSLTASKFIVTGGTSSQFLKGDGSLDSSAYLTTNIYNGNGTLSAERTVSLNGNNLIFDGGASIARVRMDADTNVARIFSFATNNLPRWAFRIDGTESGSDAGSNFAIRRYNDAGTFVDAPLTVTRSTGQSTFAKKVVIENNASDQQLQIVSTTAPSLRIDNLQIGGTKRVGLGLATAVNNFIQGSVDQDFCIFNSSTTASPILFGIYDAGLTNTQEAARISAARNFLVGTIVDAGQKLQVSGTALISGNTTVGIAAATTNVEFNLNGVSGKAQRIQFKNSGTDQWLLGPGAASETSAFELYNAGGTIVLSIDKSTNASVFAGKVNVVKSIADYAFTVTNTDSSGYGIYIQGGGTNNAIDVYNAAGTQLFNLSGSGSATFRTPGNTTGLTIRHFAGTNNPGLFITTTESNKYVSLTASGSSVAGQLLQLGAEGNIGILNISASNVLIGTTTDAGQKLQVEGNARIRNTINLDANTTTFVSTSATIISTTSNTYGGLAIVWGADTGGNIFTDFIYYSLGTFNVLASQSISGGPASRTYSVNGSGSLLLTMGSGTYTIRYQAIVTA